MAAIGDLGQLSREDREKGMPRLFEEMVDYRRDYEQDWVDVYQHVRMTASTSNVYRANFRHPYAFAALSAIHATLWPALLSGDPPFQIEDANEDNDERNRWTEKIIAKQLMNPDRSNFKQAWDRILWDANLFGTAVPWIYFKSQTRRIGPIWEPERTVDGDVAVDANGRPLLLETYRKQRVYHAPWTQHNDLWDCYRHPSSNRWNVIRRVTGRELLAQSEGANPIYDPQRVNRMLIEETKSVRQKMRSNDSFAEGDSYVRERDELAASVGAPPRYMSEYWSQLALEDVLGREYTIYHYADDQYTASYAVTAGGRWMELRFFQGSGPDGTCPLVPLICHYSPQEVWGQSSLMLNKDLLELQDRFFQAAADGAALSVHPMWVQSQSFRSLNPELITGPGAVLTAPTSGEPLNNHIDRLDMGAEFMKAFEFLAQIQGSLDDGFAQSDVTRGNYPTGRKTAFLTNQVAQASEGRMKMLHERISGMFGQRMVKKFMALNAMHLTRRDYRVYLGRHAANYTAPSIGEIIENLSCIPRGSLDAANTALRAQRWGEITQQLMNMLPYLKVRPVNEAFKKWCEDLGAESVSKVLPVPDDSVITEYMQAGMNQGGPNGAPPEPGSPTDSEFLRREISGSFGGMAPPGPSDGRSGGNGAAAVATRA
jgi:hypothetical protein